MSDSSTSRATRSRSEGLSELVHLLNQRYRQEWDRAERLQAELTDIHHSRAWRLLRLLRAVKRWFVRPATSTRVEPGGGTELLTDLPSSCAGRVSIVVPFKDQVGLLRNLLRSLRATTYRGYELVLVDNGSTSPRMRRTLKKLQAREGVTVVACPGPFNFSRLCNTGARHAAGDFLLFLNNDMEVLDPRWLESMVQLGSHPRVGVVGATLLYPDGTIQHAGIIPQGGGRWTHAYRGCPQDHPGENGELRHARTVPAVTGACLMISRSLFEELQGFREEFAVTGNDVDLCGRVRKAGRLVAVTPHARLLHFESLSRGYAAELWTTPPEAG